MGREQRRNEDISQKAGVEFVESIIEKTREQRFR
jgi:hypothetical protein